MADIAKLTLPNNNSYDIKDNLAVSNITRSGTTFTATRRNGTTFTFNQIDTNNVLEYNAKSNFPTTGESNKFYVDKSTNVIWRWNGTEYVSISSSSSATGNHTHSASYTPAGSITIKTAGSTNNTLKPVTSKTVVTDATFNTVVTGVTKKTVITGISITNETLSFTTGDSVTVSTGASGSKTTGDSVTLGNAVTVKTGDASYNFVGTAATINTGTPL